MLRLKVSGSYLKDKNSKEFSFDDMVMPECEPSDIKWAALRRALPLHFAKKGISCDYIRSCYIESIVEVADDPEVMAFKTKSIKDYSHEDCQYAAISYRLLGAPVYRSCDLMEARQKTYKAYAVEVKKAKYDNEHPFDYELAPDLVPDKEYKLKTFKKEKVSEKE